MGKYYIVKDGKLVSKGNCPDGQENLQVLDKPGAQIFLGEVPPELVPPKFKPPYQVARRQAYPSAGDQLDAMWDVLLALRPEQAMPTSAKVILQKIRTVKQNIPKT